MMGIFSRFNRVTDFIDPKAKPIVEEAQARFKLAAEADDNQRNLELDDLRFCDPEQQWPEKVKAKRDSEERPCLTVDRLGPFTHQVVNEMRQSRPQPNVNPVGDGADKETSEILQGMIRHIAYLSNGDTAIDTAFESMVRCGRGYFRVLTEFEKDDSFNQEIVIKRIVNPHMVYLDPASQEPDGSDAEWGFVGTYISHDVYKQEYPKSKMADLGLSEWKSIGDSTPQWAEIDGSGCMVMEYFRKVRKPKTIYLLKNGKTTEKLPEGVEPEDQRTSMTTEVEWYKMNAIELLDQTTWAGKYIPIIPVYGTELYVDGIRTWAGLIRSAKDAQRAFNYWKSAQAETIALAPRAPWVGPRGFMGNMRAIWQNANKRPIAALEYEPYDDKGQPIQPPTRTMQEPPIGAITNAMAGAVDDLKATTGMYDPSLGNREASQSGVAIRQLQRQGQTSNYHFQDNLARSVRHLGRVLIDLIPKIYDTKRVIRIVRPDDTSDLVTINGPSDQKDEKTGLAKVFDVRVGRYDVTVSVGPSYQTRRQENLAFLESMLQGPMGQLMATAAPDLVVAMTDFQISTQLQERLKKALPPQFQDKEEGQPNIPPQVQQQMQQAQQMVQALTQKVHDLTDQLETKQLENQAKISAAQIASATDIEVANIRAEAQIIQAKLQAKAPTPDANNDANDVLAQLSEHMSDLQNLVLAHHDMLSQPSVPPTPPTGGDQPSAPMGAPPSPAIPAGEQPAQPGALTAGLSAGMEQQNA